MPSFAVAANRDDPAGTTTLLPLATSFTSSILSAVGLWALRWRNDDIAGLASWPRSDTVGAKASKSNVALAICAAGIFGSGYMSDFDVESEEELRKCRESCERVPHAATPMSMSVAKPNPVHMMRVLGPLDTME